MKCPKCGKDVILENKKVGTDENGEPIFNQYAICKDCRKQWNLDKQRAKKAAVKHSANIISMPSAPAADEHTASVSEDTVIISKKTDADSKNTQTAPKRKRPVSETGEAAPKRKRPVSEDGGAAPRKKRPASDNMDAPKKRQTSAHDDIEAEEPRYSNIPPEKVRAKRERAVKQSYEDMLASDPDRKSVHKRKPVSEPDEEFDDDEYDDDIIPRFRVLRVLLGIISVIAFAFFAYRGFITGLNNITSGSDATTGTTFIVLALCMLVSGLLLLILQKHNTIFAFLLPTLFYLGSAIYSFLQRGDDKMLLFGAIASAVLAVIFLVLTILSRLEDNGDDEDYEDYDDPFEDDHDNY